MKIKARSASKSTGPRDSKAKTRKTGGVRVKVRRAAKGNHSPPEDGRLRRGKFIKPEVNVGMKNKDFKSLIRVLFEKPSGKYQTKRAKDRLAKIALKKALKGDFFFWSKLVDLHDSNLVNEDDLAEFTERIYLTVRRHVEKLEGGNEALADIARDLQRENI